MSFVYRLNAFAARQTTVKPASLAPARPIASFSFDDFPLSAWETGGAILERRGVRGTYYAAGTYCGRRVEGIDYYDGETLKALVAAGHELGSHSFEHEPGPSVSPARLEADLERNAAFLSETSGAAGPFSYAYPYGLVSTPLKRLIGAQFPSARGIHPGVNGRRTDLSQLKAIALERRSWRAETVERWLAAARAQHGWLVFFSHDVSDDPTPFGCTPAMLEHALDAARDAGFDLLPVDAALARAQA